MASWRIVERGNNFALLNDGITYDTYDTRELAEHVKTRMEGLDKLINKLEDAVGQAVEALNLTREEKELLKENYSGESLLEFIGIWK